MAAPRVTTARTPPAMVNGETLLTIGLLAGAVLLGMVLQVWLPHGALTMVAAAALAGAFLVVLAHVVRGRLRQTIAGFRFVAALLFVLAALAVLGTLIIQMKPAEFYLSRYGELGAVMVGLRLDDLFHGLPFAFLLALFVASIVASATLRWPPSLRSAGYLACHVGLLTSLAGAAASATLAVRGRVDLHAGGDRETRVQVTRAGQHTGETAPLGFELALDRFEAQSYEAEFRVGYYEHVVSADENGRVHEDWKLVASFDPDLARHRLPQGDTFRLREIRPDQRGASQDWRDPAVVLEVSQQGRVRAQRMLAREPSAIFLSPTRALTFEKRAEEKRAYVSWVTVRQGSSEARRIIKVNEPIQHGGWTLYQANYDPRDPTYSGLDAVHDPGVPWVFAGFALICAGVLFMFYVEPRLRRRSGGAAASRA